MLAVDGEVFFSMFGFLGFVEAGGDVFGVVVELVGVGGVHGFGTTEDAGKKFFGAFEYRDVVPGVFSFGVGVHGVDKADGDFLFDEGGVIFIVDGVGVDGSLEEGAHFAGDVS